MKLRPFLFIAAFAAILSFSSAAKAAYVSGGDDLGGVAVGQTGTYTYNMAGGDLFSLSFGGSLLPTDTIYFSLAFSPVSDFSSDVTYATYKYSLDSHAYSGTTFATANLFNNPSGSSSFSASVDNVPSLDQLVFASANFLPTKDGGSSTITNASGGLATFAMIFSGTMGLADGFVKISYNVVPLPAALPLFGLGLVGLAGLRARKRRETD